MASAQEQMRIWQNGEDTRVALSDIVYADGGASFTVGGKTYQTSQIDSITMVHVITVTWDGAQATVEKGNVLGVDCSVQGGDVTITSTNTHTAEDVVAATMARWRLRLVSTISSTAWVRSS